MPSLSLCVFSLMQCPRCHGAYALCPDPANQRDVLLFSARAPAWPPLAAMAGGFLCHWCGADLTLVQEAAALSADARWIALPTAASRSAGKN